MTVTKAYMAREMKDRASLDLGSLSTILRKSLIHFVSFSNNGNVSPPKVSKEVTITGRSSAKATLLTLKSQAWHEY